MTEDHIVTAFDNDLNGLNLLIAKMGGLAEVQLANAVESLVTRNNEQAEDVRAKDKEIDAIEGQVHLDAVQLLAMRQPLADDLRIVISAFQTASALERIGDYARNIAKRATVLNQMPAMVGPIGAIARMSGLAQSMISDVLNAYQTRDVDLAEDVRLRDLEVDQLHTSLFRELLTYMMEDPHSITACTHLLFVAKNIERIGDHATNIAEYIHMVVHGKEPDELRPKHDKSSVTLVENPNAPNNENGASE